MPKFGPPVRDLSDGATRGRRRARKVFQRRQPALERAEDVGRDGARDGRAGRVVGAEDAAEPAGGGGGGAGDAAAVRGARVDDVAERLGTRMDPARVYAVDARHAAVGLGARVWVLAVGLGPRGARPDAVLVGNIDGHPERALPRRREQPSGVSVHRAMHAGIVELRLDDGAAHVKLPAGTRVHAERR